MAFKATTSITWCPCQITALVSTWDHQQLFLQIVRYSIAKHSCFSSIKFINLPPERLDDQVLEAQRRICESIGVELSALWQWDEEDPGNLTLTHVYRPLGGPPIPEQMDARELLTHYLPSIQALFPEFTLEYVEDSTLWQAAYAQPIVHVGYRHSIPAIASPIANFFVCTMAQIYPHDRQLSNGVDLAQHTAEIVMQQIFSD